MAETPLASGQAPRSIHAGEYQFGPTDPAARASEQPAYAKYRENVRWTMGDVVFLTLSLPRVEQQSWNGHDWSAGGIHRANAADLAWLRDGFGDTHYFRVDRPFSDSTTRLVIPTITRAETYGNPNFHAIVMTVDTASPNLFRFEPLAVPRNAPR